MQILRLSGSAVFNTSNLFFMPSQPGRLYQGKTQATHAPQHTTATWICALTCFFLCPVNQVGCIGANTNVNYTCTSTHCSNMDLHQNVSAYKHCYITYAFFTGSMIPGVMISECNEGSATHCCRK